MRSGIASALLAAGSIALPVLVGEIACRLAGYRGLEVYRPDSELGWALAPRQTTVTRASHLPVRVNEDGFRDDPLERPKSAETVRIFALGASTTFGWGVEQHESYHQVLERMLNDSARAAGAATRFEIVNAGVIGYNLWQAARYLRRIAQRHEPDGFLVAYTFNDAWNRFGTLNAQQRDRLLAGVRRKNVLRASALFNWLVEVRARWLSESAGGGALGDESAIAQTGDTSATTAELAAYRATLDSTIALARTAKLSLAFTVLAARGQRRAWPRQAAMAQAAAAGQVPAIDLVPLFGAAGADSLYLSNDAVHPSRLGHAMIARLMYDHLCAAATAAAPGEPVTVYRAGCGRARRHPA
jgi:lysophospholipase L1-like esterase